MTNAYDSSSFIMMENLCDQYSQFLQDSSGWTRSVAEKCPKGTESCPSILLEVHPRFPRPIFRNIALTRNLLLVALGDAVVPENFDKIIADVDMTKHSSGLDKQVMGLLPKNTLESVVIAHQSECMEEDSLAELLITAVERIADGGTVHLIDKPGTRNYGIRRWGGTTGNHEGAIAHRQAYDIHIRLSVQWSYCVTELRRGGDFDIEVDCWSEKKIERATKREKALK